MRIQISDHFTVGKLLRFVFPSIIMMIFTSIYGVVDGFFVSNYVGKTPFAAVNLIMPLLMAVGAIGFMLGSGGSALVAKTCGEGDAKRANRYFSMVIYAAVIIGFAAALVCFFLIRPIASMMGARGEMLEYCVLYARILIFTLPMFMLQNMFQSFFITAEKPHLGLYVILAAGVANMVLDFLFIVVFHWGLAGAAVATGIGETIGGVVPLIYFARPNTSRLKLVRTKLEWHPLWRSCSNGASEMMTNLSMSIVNTLYNLQLMRFAGEDGVKRVRVLSGGEKVRCLLSKMMISGANVLVLDEPTNHLDMESITALNNGLIKFPGVLLFTCHDHQFVQTTANRIMEILPNGALIDKMTTYDEYLASDEMARKRHVYTMTEEDN